VLCQLSYWPIHRRSGNRVIGDRHRAIGDLTDPVAHHPIAQSTIHLLSLWPVCLRQNRQYLLNSSRSVVFFLFFVVL
jgi:hypothetical protein